MKPNTVRICRILSSLRRAVLLLAAFAFTTAARAQTIANPSFEVNSYTVFPGYIFTPGNGGIAGWSHNGAVGLNPAGGNPFADNGAVPQGSNVAFIQSVNLPGDYANGVSLLNTLITGLTPGVSYTVRFRANSRTSSFYGAPTPSWSVNGEAFLPFTAAPSVGGANAYYTVTRTFTATAATAGLNIMNNTAATGGPADTTVLVDDFTIAIAPPVVTNTNDSGPGSLRQAVINAAAIPGANTVTFDPALSGATIVLASEIVITDAASVSIDASSLSAGVTIDGGAGTNRLFSVSSGKSLALLGLTLTGGNGGGVAQNGNGGAIVNFGTLALTRCTLSGNAGGSGGAILNDGGTLTLTQCTLSGNSTTNGGAIYQTTGTLTLTHSTLSGNQASDIGGAIYKSNGTLTLTHCTLSGNQASSNGGAIFNESGPLTLANSIVAGNTSGTGTPDIDSFFGLTATGVNFVGNTTGSGLPASATILTTAANGPINLAPLDDYGGPTKTRALKPGSPARNAATGSPATNDQRGFPIVGGTPDIGAYEAGTFTNYNAFIWESLPASANAPQHASSVDFDGDGVTNGNEWLALTDAADPSNYLRVTQAVLSGGDIYLTFPTVVGRNYTFEFSFNLAPGTWTPLGFTVAGTGSPVTFPIGPVTGYSQLFFRVRVGP